jgi:hypothetical protein
MAETLSVPIGDEIDLLAVAFKHNFKQFIFLGRWKGLAGPRKD